MENFSCLVFVNHVASALPSQRKSYPLQYLQNVLGRYPGQLLGHTATSKEVRLIHSNLGYFLAFTETIGDMKADRVFNIL